MAQNILQMALNYIEWLGMAQNSREWREIPENVVLNRITGAAVAHNRDFSA
jgi:hypothetical protein